VTNEPTVISLPSNSTTLLYTFVKPGDSFYVFSAHSRVAEVTLSYSQHLNYVDHVSSTAPGLMCEVDGSGRCFRQNSSLGLYLFNQSPHHMSVVVVVRGYPASAPVPGWCAIKLGVRPKPFLRIDYDSNVIRVNFSKASLLHNQAECDVKASVTYSVYQLFLGDIGQGNKGNPDQQFLSALQSFSSIEDIQSIGTEVPHYICPTEDRLVFASYPGVGRLFAVVASHENSSSLYTVGHSYGCPLDPETESCSLSGAVLTNLLSALALFLGLVLCFSGHRFFLYSQCMFGLYFGCSLGYILSAPQLSLAWAPLVVSLGAGLLCSALSGLAWAFLGLPVLAVLLPTLELGTLLASILFYVPGTGLSDSAVLSSSSTDYWLVYSCISLALPLLTLAFTQQASILSCVLLGAYTVLVPLDYFLGTTVRFLSINTVRRAVSPATFSRAIISPPFSTACLALVAATLGMAGLGLAAQLLMARNKAPFPPPQGQQWRWRRQLRAGREEGTASEISPLINSVEEVVVSPVVGYISTHRRLSTESEAVRPMNTSTRGRQSDIFIPPSRTYDNYSPINRSNIKKE